MTNHIPGTAQMTTSVSDLALVICASFAAGDVYASSQFASIGFAAFATAAAIGVFRFAGVRAAVPYHNFFTDVASTAGMVFLAATFIFDPRSSSSPSTTVVGAIAAAVFAAFYFGSKKNPKLRELVPLVIGLIFASFAIYRFYFAKIWDGIGAVASFLAIGIMGPNGQIGGIKYVDIFHYVLAGVCIVLGGAIDRLW